MARVCHHDVAFKRGHDLGSRVAALERQGGLRRWNTSNREGGVS